jgi:hypothetical protein
MEIFEIDVPKIRIRVRMSPRKPIQYYIDENGCWICVSHYKDIGGYPIIRTEDESRHMSRYIWKRHNGPIPEGLFVCHQCDNPACINLEHLFLGTDKDNMADKCSKFRHNYGEKVPSAKLKERDVLEIKNTLGTQQKIATKYGICRQNVGYIKSGKRWKHLNNQLSI